MKWKFGLMLSGAFLLGAVAGGARIETEEDRRSARNVARHALVQMELATERSEIEGAVQRMARAFCLAPTAAREQVIEWKTEDWLNREIERETHWLIQNEANRRQGLPHTSFPPADPPVPHDHGLHGSGSNAETSPTPAGRSGGDL